MFRCTLVCLLALIAVGYARPQGKDADEFRPYEYEYKVEDQPTNNYFGQNEVGDQPGKVTGKYYVLLADGRLMTVDYSVDGDSGFVPKLTFQANANPFQG